MFVKIRFKNRLINLFINEINGNFLLGISKVFSMFDDFYLFVKFCFGVIILMKFYYNFL